VTRPVKIFCGKIFCGKTFLVKSFWRGGCAIILALFVQSCSPDLSEIRPVDQGMRFLHPYPQPRPGRTIQRSSLDGSTTYAETAMSIYQESNPFIDPPGSNFINNVESNMFDGFGREMPNTLPSTREKPYNLHDGEVKISKIDPRSPASDLALIFKRVRLAAVEGTIDRASLQEAVNIIEGNRVFPDRAYNGFPLLHYNGPNKVKRVVPIFDESGRKIGGNVNVRQIWYGGHIESDTAFIDPSDVFNVPWTVTYTVDVLERGMDDFAPYVLYYDDPFLSAPGRAPKAHVGMDASFFPMMDGTRSIIKLKMSKGKYFNLTYHWGWRVHPPRIQVIGNARATINGRTLPGWERHVFGDNPMESRESQLAAIAKIGDLSPAKRMWKAALAGMQSNSPDEVLSQLDEAVMAFDDWDNRRQLPRGVKFDEDSDLTLLFVNNTLYGQVPGGKGVLPRLDYWKTRGQLLKISLMNGDYFVHSYSSADFGGSRGWENQFQSTVNKDGSGAWFTFGRNHWWINVGSGDGLIDIAPAQEESPGRHKVELTLNFDPSRRLRLYNFDPLHHDVAIFSLH